MNKIMFWLLSIIAMLAFAVGPMLVQYNHWSLGYSGSGDWLSFWGSYLGIVPSGLIAYLVTRTQIDEQRKDERESRNQQMYLDDLKNINITIDNILSVIELMGTLKLTSGITINGTVMNADTSASLLRDAMNETEYGLRLSSHLNHLKNSLPYDGNIKISENLSTLSDHFDSVESLINLRYLEIINHNDRSQTEENFKVNLFENGDKIDSLVDDLSNELKKEIKKYYSLKTD